MYFLLVLLFGYRGIAIKVEQTSECIVWDNTRRYTVTSGEVQQIAAACMDRKQLVWLKVMQGAAKPTEWDALLDLRAAGRGGESESDSTSISSEPEVENVCNDPLDESRIYIHTALRAALSDEVASRNSPVLVDGYAQCPFCPLKRWRNNSKANFFP